MGYLKTSIKGISWMGGLRIASRAIILGRTAILARLLTPAQFGLYGIAALTLSLMEKITSTGINVFLIQDNRKLDEYINTAWTISILRGFFIATTILLSSSFISGYFEMPETAYLIKLIAVVAFIRGFINPSRIKYQKILKFEKEFLFSGSILITDVVVATVFTFILRSPAGIVWGLISSASLEVVLSFVITKPTPNLLFEKEKAKKIIKKGKWITGSRIFAYLYQEGDDLLVGKLLKASPLGFYQMAYKISTLPISDVSNVVNSVMFPVYTKFKNDIKRLRRAYIITVFAVAALVLPFGLILVIFTRELVLVILGNNWLEIVPVLRVLLFFGIIQSIIATSNALFLSTNNQKYVMFSTLFNVIGMLVFIYPFIINFGIVGAAYSVLIGSLVSAPVRLYLSYKILK